VQKHNIWTEHVSSVAQGGAWQPAFVVVSMLALCSTVNIVLELQRQPRSYEIDNHLQQKSSRSVTNDWLFTIDEDMITCADNITI